VFAILAGGCAVESNGSAPADPGSPSGASSPGGKGDDLRACLTPRAEPIAPPEDLVALSDIPLPSFGPTADGWFHPETHYSEGGTFLTPDLRPEWSVPESEIAAAAAPGTLRVVEWNVARGNELAKLIQVMRRTNADVWILNETDLYGQNSGNVVVAREMARALGYSYYTTTEFYEKRDDRRGMSGNAIVSRYPMFGSARMTTPMFLSEGGYDWATSGSEPRCGQRSALSARVDVPAVDGGTRSVNIVSLHTENKANAKVRRMQFDAVVNELVTPGEATVVAGDLNTVSPFEGGNFRKYLEERWGQHGPVGAQMDCSRGDDTHTFSAALVVNMRIDWMLLQPGSENGPSCPTGSYKVLDAKGASDHRPVKTEMVVP
jgi:endonuclease/exonuclease/phosphatase family metal-dependent hydrolase